MNTNINTNMINNLQNYMFTTTNLDKFNSLLNLSSKNNSNLIKNNLIKTNLIKNNINDFFLPKEEDTLFWCLYYILNINTENEYNNIVETTKFIKEKELKFNFIKLLRENKDVLKCNKIKPLSELEDDLANKKQISIKTFIGLAIINKINVLLVDIHKYYESINNDTDLIYIISKHDKQNKYIIDLTDTTNKVNTYRNTYYKLEIGSNGLKSISSYKLDELIELSKKLGITLDEDKNKKLTKKDIYEQIVQKY
jgi:hypothetical protein